jgi:flagellar basal body-associated protein FliL
MKKGISLIVLVITIIVMIIIAGSIIISLNSSNVIDKANTAVTATDVGALNDQLQLAYVDLKLEDAYKSKNDFTESTAVTVAGTAYDTIVKFYTKYAPELANLATKYSDYKLVIAGNGAASVVKK